MNEKTGRERSLANLRPFQPGNPGRPKGSRNKLGEEFISALQSDFNEHGVVAIQQVRQDRPHEYLKVIASLLPKELKVTTESDLTDEQLIERIQRLDAVIRPFLSAEGEGGVGGGDAASPVTH